MKNNIFIYFMILLIGLLVISNVSATSDLTSDDASYILSDTIEVDSNENSLEISENVLEEETIETDLRSIETNDMRNEERDILKQSDEDILGAKITEFSIPNTFYNNVTPTLRDSSGNEIINAKITYNFDEKYYGSAYTGVGAISVPTGILSGSYHTFSLNYTGNSTYMSCVKIFKFYKNGTKCTISDTPAETTHFEVPSEVTNSLKVVLKDSSGKLVTNASIAYYFDGNSQNKLYITNGKSISLSFTPNSKHKVTFVYDGKELLYAPCNGTFSFHIQSSITVNESGMYYTEGGMNIPYTLLNSKWGVAEHGETFAPFGRSTISIYNSFTNETLEKVINVKKRILESEDLTVDYEDLIEYRVRVADSNDNYVSGLNVDYSIMDNNYDCVDSGYAISDDDGYATFTMHLKASNYTIRTYYCGVVNENNLLIKPIYISNKYRNVFLKSVTTYYDDSRKILNYGWEGYFKGTLNIYEGSNLVKSINLNSEGYLYDYFTYESIKKSFNTNNLKSLGTFKAQIVDVDGKVLATSTIKIMKAPTKIVAKNLKSYVGKKITVKVNVRNKKTNANITVGKIKFRFNGKTYSAKVSKGVAKITLKMPSKVKKFKSSIKFLVNKYNYASSAVINITVKRIPSEVYEKENTFYAKTNTKTSLKAHVYIKDTTKLIKSGNVRFTFRGKNYNVKLVKGVATLKIKMPSKIGTYKYKVKYLGSSKYAPSSNTFKVVVKKKLGKGQYMDWCHGGDVSHKAVWTKKYYGKSLVGTVKIKGVYYKKYVKLYRLTCSCDKNKYHKAWLKSHNQNHYTYETVTATSSPTYVYKKIGYKTISVSTKFNKYVSKKSGSYKVETYKFKSSWCDELCIWLYKNGKMIKKSNYFSKYYYTKNGKSYSTAWRKGGVDSTYHHYQHDKNMKVTSVKVKFLPI